MEEDLLLSQQIKFSNRQLLTEPIKFTASLLIWDFKFLLKFFIFWRFPYNQSYFLDKLKKKVYKQMCISLKQNELSFSNISNISICAGILVATAKMQSQSVWCLMLLRFSVMKNTFWNMKKMCASNQLLKSRLFT